MQSTPQQQYDLNITFLEEKIPYLADIAKNHELTKTTLSIDKGRIDIHSGNDFLYKGDARKYSTYEVEKFLQNSSSGNQISGLAVYPKDAFNLNRFFSNSMKSLLEKNPPPEASAYQIPEFLPCLVIMGIGAGLHIKKLVKEKEILNLIIYETEPEEFLTSLYIIDWKSIYEKFTTKGKSIRIMVNNSKITHDQFAHIWNTLVDQTPFFALSTFIYNHRNQRKNNKIIKRIKENMKVYLTLWGFYDDDINQFNNGIHNLYNNHNLLPKKGIDAKDLPVFIIGSGPSLDERIQEIERYKNNAIIISSGTALRSLYKYGIKPDIHVEVESHYEPYNVVSEISDEEFMKDIILIGAVQITPKLASIFKNTILFTKDSTSLYKITYDNSNQLKGTTPTCTNSAFSISTYFRFKNIYLFGTDYGFKDNASHHSKNSIYYSANISETIERSNSIMTSKNVFEIESVDGGTVLTTPIYNSSKSRIEADYNGFIQEYKFNLYNCSNGAKIKNAKHTPSLSDSDFTKGKIEKETFIKELLSTKNNIEKDKINLHIKSVKNDLINITSKIIKIGIKNDNMDLVTHFKNINIIGQYLSYGLTEYGPTSFMVKGSIWIYLHQGASIALLLQNNPDKLSKFISEWDNSFYKFIEDIPRHFSLVTEKYFTHDDPWIHTNLEDTSCKDYL